MKSRYYLIRKKLPNGGYLVSIPALPGCMLFVRSLTQEEIMLPQVIAIYLARAEKSGTQISSDEIYTVSRITIDT